MKHYANLFFYSSKNNDEEFFITFFTTKYLIFMILKKYKHLKTNCEYGILKMLQFKFSSFELNIFLINQHIFLLEKFVNYITE